MGKNEDLFNDQQSNLFDNFQRSATEWLEDIAETIAGPAETLRDGTEFDPVTLPRDLWAHPNAQTEWWYYTGHGELGDGRAFGFELVFFKRRTDLDRFSLLPLRMLGNPIYFAHFALTDIDGGVFRYAHRKSANGWFDEPAAASEEHYYLRLGDWTLRESHGAHVLRATAGDIVFEATLRPTKPVVLNGSKSDGVSFKDAGEASRYFAYTRMEMEGDLVRDGRVGHFTGTAWMDREFGTWAPTDNQKGWDWFSIQFNNGSELMCYQLRDANDNVSPYSSGTFIDADGSFAPLRNDEFSIEPTGFWRSQRSGAVYPSGWRVKCSKHGFDLTVTPHLEDQELDTRGTTMIVYWEGACAVSGSHVGRAYVELVGYDRSHESPNLAHFLMGNKFEA